MPHRFFLPALGLCCTLLAAAPASLLAANTEDWSQRSLPSAGYGIAYDEAHHELVTVAPLASGATSTWIWKGKGWKQQFPQNSPGDSHGVMAYDPVRQETVFLADQNSISGPLTWVWDGTNWTQKFPSAEPPIDGTMAYDPKMKKILLFGGYVSDNPSLQTWTWDGTNWEQLSPTNNPAGLGVLAYDKAAKQLVFFGGYPYEQTGQTWFWNGTNWIQQAPQNNPPSGGGIFGATYDPTQNGIVLVTFGDTNINTYLWTGSNWLQQSPQNAPDLPSTMAFYPEENRVVMPVVNNRQASSDAWIGVTWLWDGSNWTPTAPTEGRAWASFAGIGSKQFLLFGGYNANATSLLGDTWVGDGRIWTQQSSANSPSARQSAAIAFDESRNEAVLFGGVGAIGSLDALADTWIWKNGSWTQLHPPNSPPARWSHTMSYDKGRGEIVLFGGFSGSAALNDTWVWDGNTWTEKVSATTPPARRNAAMAYTPQHRQTVLFGGAGTSGGPLGDTWTWDGKSWTQQFPATSPSARQGTGMAYDAASKQVLLFGGEPAVTFPNYQYLADTWAWNGTNWNQLSPAIAPQTRAYYGIASEPAGKIMIYGGQNPPNPVSIEYRADSWVWGEQP